MCKALLLVILCYTHAWRHADTSQLIIHSPEYTAPPFVFSTLTSFCITTDCLFLSAWNGGSLYHNHYVVGVYHYLHMWGLESSSIRSLMMMFHKVGLETDPCGQSLVTLLELSCPLLHGPCAPLESPALSCRCLGDSLVSRAGRGFPGARRCRRRLLYPMLGGSTSVQFFCSWRRVRKRPLCRRPWIFLL